MNWRTVAINTATGVAVAVVTVAALVAISELKPTSKPLELICYRDATLTERHIGVARAVYNDRGVWTLFYRDGEATGATVYRQEAGESCMTVEEVAP